MGSHKLMEHGTLIESINIDDIEKCLGKSLDEAAKECGVSRSTFKRACRRHGIRRWKPKKRKKHEDQQSNLGEENTIMASSCMSTELEWSEIREFLAVGTSIRQDNNNNTRLWVKVEHKNDVVKFVLGQATLDGLKREILKRFKLLEGESIRIRYRDGDEEMVSVGCDEDLHYCLEFFKSMGKTPVRFYLFCIT